MGIFLNLLLGLGIIAGSFAILKYNYQVVNSFGSNNWFERNLGSGSSYGVAKIGAILGMILGVLVMFGLMDNILGWVLSPLTNVLS